MRTCCLSPTCWTIGLAGTISILATRGVAVSSFTPWAIQLRMSS